MRAESRSVAEDAAHIVMVRQADETDHQSAPVPITTIANPK